MKETEEQKQKRIDKIYKRYENNKSKSMEVSIGFQQGFICATCILIQFYGCVTTEVKELWACGGLKSTRDLDRYGIDDHDKEIILKHKSELF